MGQEKSKYTKIEGFESAWEEIRFCALLIREGRAKIVSTAGPDGHIVRYTKPKRGQVQSVK
jgi:hypothetical protein